MDPNENINTALLKAAADNSKEVVALLLDNPGVDVNVALDTGMTAIWSSGGGHAASKASWGSCQCGCK